MQIQKVDDYHEMSVVGAEIIYEALATAMRAGRHFNLGLATGNTMIELYRILAERINRDCLDLSGLETWNLDEYAIDERRAVSHEHPLSYWRYMHEKFFDLLSPDCKFSESQAHFPNPANPSGFDAALALSGGLDLQLLGIGFNGHIAFNEPECESSISVEDFAALPTRVLPLTEETILQNTKVTADGDSSLVPRFAATMGMAQILAARRELLLACFAEQEEPLRRMIAGGRATPELPASYLLSHRDFTLIYTGDKITL